MKHVKCSSLWLIVFLLAIGCSGSNANIKNLSQSESRAIQQELLDNWSDYIIRYNLVVIVFDPKDDDNKIVVDNYWYRVEDQETWTQIVSGFKTVPFGVNQVWGEPIREIWVHNQFYGYVSHQGGMLVAVNITDEHTVRLYAHVGYIVSKKF